MIHDNKDVETVLKEIFKEHKFVLVDCNEYEGRVFNVPKGRVVSYKWLNNAIFKRLKNKEVK